MKRYTDLEYLKLSKINRFFYKFLSFIIAIPTKVWGIIKLIGKYIALFTKKVVKSVVEIFTIFKNGDWKTRVSYVVMGFGNIARGQIGRGVLFLLFELVFIFYMET